MDALLKIKQNHRVAPIPLNQLINLTYNTDICCFAPRVSNHEELGAFLYANEMLSNEAMALLDTTEEGSGFQERLLELLGEQHQEDHGGVFTDFGYAELGGEIKDIYVCQSNETACFHRSDAPVVLEVRKGFFNDPSYDNDKTAVLNLPAADAGIWRAVEKVDAASVDECAFRCVDCLIPFLRDAINNAIDDEDGIEQADEFAKRLAQIEREWPESDMVKYKALLSVVDHPSLQDATRLMGEIDQYELRPEVAQTWGYRTEQGVVADSMFRREELEDWLARKGLAVRWEDGIYDRLSSGGYQKAADNGPALKSCRIWQLGPSAPAAMRFIGLDRMSGEYGGPDLTRYQVVFDGTVSTNSLDGIWEAFCRRSLGSDGQPLAISDLVELYDDSGSEFYYVDRTAIVPVQLKAPEQESGMTMTL